MKQAVIATGGKQYLVNEGEELEIERLKESKGSLEFKPLLIIDGEKTDIGSPELSTATVVAEVIDPEYKADKVVSIRYKAKKRVHKLHGHRQLQTKIRITKIG